MYSCGDCDMLFDCIIPYRAQQISLIKSNRLEIYTFINSRIPFHINKLNQNCSLFLIYMIFINEYSLPDEFFAV